ncbi:MAG TPA: hypothetical protein VMX18_00960 [Candidatus Bipolaricaulota bacterium]|nr:hypothetical protein [Candidatus Bipolaricaulota bacterium]
MSDEMGKHNQEMKEFGNKEKTSRKLPETLKPTKAASIIVGVVLILITTAVIFYFSQSQTVQRAKETVGAATQNELQAKIDELNKHVADLEEKDRINQELIERDLPEAAKVVEDCSIEFNDGYPSFSDKIPFYLKYNNRAFAYYQQQGYELKQACRANEKFLMLLDSTSSYDKLSAKNAATADLTAVSTKAIIGISDKIFFKIDYFPVKIDGYDLAKDHKTVCVFDKYEGDKIYYVCDTPLEDGDRYDWYVFDAVKKVNVKAGSKSPQGEEISNKDLWNNFSIKSL